MKNAIIVANVILLTLAAGAWGADVPNSIQPRLTVVHYGALDVDTYYYYIAAIPMNVFHYGGKCYQSPLLVDTNGAWADYFHDDLAAYFAGVNGLKQITTIGAVPAAIVDNLKSKYGVSAGDVVALDATGPAAMAEKIARDWERSDNAVLVPYVTSPTDDDYESAANGAALASSLNCPLLFVNKDSVPDETFKALGHAGVKTVYLVEFGDYCSTEVNAALGAGGYAVAQDFTVLKDFVSFIRGRSGHVALMTYREDTQSLPAALAAARHGGFVAKLDTAVSDLVASNAALLAGLAMPTERFGVGEWAPPKEYDAGEQAIADAFVNWLGQIGAADATQLEWVTYFGPKSGNGNEYCNFDRAIVGNPLEPDKEGCLPGRFPGDFGQNICYLNRATLYPAIIFGNPHYDRSVMAFNSFVCHYYEQGYKFTDNGGQSRCVNEIFGVPEFKEHGVAERFDANGYEIIYDSGYYAGTYQGNNFHPINPAWHTLDGYFKYLNDGSNFWYYSGHGDISSISSMSADKGVNETVAWGQPHWPATAGIITSAPGSLSINTWDTSLANIHGAVINFDACLVGGGDWNESGMRHGGSGANSSYISVSWEGSGWYYVRYAEYLTAGKPFAEAMAYALGQTSHIYPQHKNGVDGSLMYYWVGDPFMVLYQPTWTKPTPSPLSDDYGGHRPGNFVDIELSYFRAVPADGGVRVAWGVREGEYAGFNLYRESEGNGGGSAVSSTPTKVNATRIVGRSPLSFLDREAEAGAAASYRLEAIDLNGYSRWFGPVKAAAGAKPSSYNLGQNYPNPVRASTCIDYAVPEGKRSRLELTFFDLAGRRVAGFDLGVPEAGNYQFQWHADGLPPGVYFYRLYADGASVAQRKLVISE